MNLRTQPPAVDPQAEGPADGLQPSQLVVVDCAGDELSRAMGLDALIKGKLLHGHPLSRRAEQGGQLVRRLRCCAEVEQKGSWTVGFINISTSPFTPSPLPPSLAPI